MVTAEWILGVSVLYGLIATGLGVLIGRHLRNRSGE